jgi:hypothetical protein
MPILGGNRIDIAALFEPHWLNHWVDQAGTWQRGQERAITSTDELVLNGADVEILEVSMSGGATLSGIGAALAASGIPEVFLTVTYASGESEYRSAPSSIAYKLLDVQRLSLSTLCVVGNDACSEVVYSIVANAHCQWRYAY